jgi:hypothetical protein
MLRCRFTDAYPRNSVKKHSEAPRLFEGSKCFVCR